MSVTTLFIQDLNYDGIDDLYVENGNGGKVWLEGNGTGGLIFHAECPTLTTSITIEFTDSFAGTVDISENYTDEPLDMTFGDPFFALDSTSPISTSGEITETFHDATHDSPILPPRIASPEIFDTIELPSSVMDYSNPEQAEPSFHFKASPDLNFTSDLNTTADYSSEDSAMEIDLQLGTVANFTCNSWFENSFNRYSDERWSNTDEIVNAIGSESSDDIYGNDLANYLDGGNGADWINAEGGDDTLVGGKGSDILFGGNGDDLMAEQQGSDFICGDNGNDLIYGNRGNSFLFGDSGSDTLLGGVGEDLLFGGDGNDILYGGKGADHIFGNSGSDTFHYESPLEGGDTIYAFSTNEDTLEFAFCTHNLSTVTEPYSGNGGETEETFIWETTGHNSGILYYDADGSVAGDEIIIAQIDLTGDDDHLTIDDITIS